MLPAPHWIESNEPLVPRGCVRLFKLLYSYFCPFSSQVTRSKVLFNFLPTHLPFGDIRIYLFCISLLYSLLPRQNLATHILICLGSEWLPWQWEWFTIKANTGTKMEYLWMNARFKWALQQKGLCQGDFAYFLEDITLTRKEKTNHGH